MDTFLYDTLEHYRNIAEVSSEGVFIIDSQGTTVYANQKMAGMLGYMTDEIEGTAIQGFLSEHSNNIFKNTFSARDKVTMGHVDLKFCRKDGSYLCTVFSATPILDNAGSYVGLVAIVKDITERKRMEEAILLAGTYNRSLLEVGLDPLVTISLDGMITDVNVATEKVTGYSRAELIGTDFSNYFTDPDKAREGYMQVFKEGSVKDYPLEIRHKDEHITPVVYNASVYRDKAGKVIGVFAAARDVTELNKAQEALKQKIVEVERSNAELQQFAYVASHDLQEPLRMVTSYVNLLGRRYKDKLDADAVDFINYAIEGSTRMQQMINDLLTYSRVGAKGKQLEMTDLEKIYNYVLVNLRVSIAESNAVVTHDPLPEIMSDELQMLQLFQNLVGNAIKFRSADRPPVVHVSAMKQDGVWEFSVSDNGIGIDPQYFDRIFIIFNRLHTRADYPGSGIGLAICKKIVELHGGRIWVESIPDKGSTFRFTIRSGVD